AKDKADGVADLLRESAAKLAAVKDDQAVRGSYPRLAEAAGAMRGQTLEQLRVSFKDVSAAMIEIGKNVGTPPDSAAVKVFRCPMKKANWLQEGDATVNPYYGSMMYDCGSAVESLPKAAPEPTPSKQRSSGEGSRMLSVPRSAVIDTGSAKIVYVES